MTIDPVVDVPEQLAVGVSIACGLSMIINMEHDKSNGGKGL